MSPKKKMNGDTVTARKVTVDIALTLGSAEYIAIQRAPEERTAKWHI
jgi:hypothetical protein